MAKNSFRIYVYMIINKVNGKNYIGVHKQSYKHKDVYMGGGKLIKYAIEKYGIENFYKIILKDFDNEIDAYEYEKELVNQKLIEDKNNYNIRLGGKGGSKKGQFKGRPAWNKGLKTDQSIKDKISKSRKGIIPNREYGSLTDEVKNKISNTLTGKKLDDERKAAISLGGKRRWILYRVNKIMKKRYEENTTSIRTVYS